LILLCYTGGRTYSEGIVWIIAATVIILVLLTIFQIIVNYQLYPKLCRYLYIHITNELCPSSDPKIAP
jgi:uncharacterized membrane protein YjdF